MKKHTGLLIATILVAMLALAAHVVLWVLNSYIHIFWATLHLLSFDISFVLVIILTVVTNRSNKPIWGNMVSVVGLIAQAIHLIKIDNASFIGSNFPIYYAPSILLLITTILLCKYNKIKPPTLAERVAELEKQIEELKQKSRIK